MKNYLYIFLALLSLTSCAELDSGFMETIPKPVVEGYLVPGQQVRVKVHKEIPYSADSTTSSRLEVPVSGLKITLIGEGQKEILSEEADGYYAASTRFLIKVGGSYQISFTYNGLPVSASTAIPSKPQGFKASTTYVARAAIDLSAGFSGGRPPGGFGSSQTNINLEWLNPQNDFFITVVESIDPNPIEIIKFPVSDNRPRPESRFRNQPVQGTAGVIGSQSFQYFGMHRLILFKLNPDYPALYQRTGNTTQNISTPPTTILNGLGIFTGVNADTLMVRVIPE
jgi:hypothetical protein